MNLYQSLVTVNPVTLIAQICNLFIQLFIFKRFFYDRVQAVLDQRREAAHREISDAEQARAEALALRETYEENLRHSRQEADRLLAQARQTADARTQAILTDARAQAVRLREKASAEITREKQRAMEDAREEISVIAIAIAEKVVSRQLTAADHRALVSAFLDDLGDVL